MSFCRVDWVVSGILQRVVGHHGHLFARNRPIRLKGAVRVAVNDISIDGRRIAPAYQSDEATSWKRLTQRLQKVPVPGRQALRTRLG